MNLEEFNNFMLNFIDSDFPVREISILYSYSIPLQIDEVKSDRHLNLFFPDFIEAFSRLIDKSSPMPINGNASEWTKEKREKQHLADKLLNVFPYLSNYLSGDPKVELAKFQKPTKDEETDLLKFEASSPFYEKVFPRSNISFVIIRKKNKL